MARDAGAKVKDKVLQLTITHSGDAEQPPCISYQDATSSSQGDKKLKVDVDLNAVQRSKLLQELSTVADGEGQQGICTTFTLPCSAVLFSQWNSFTTAGAKQLSVEGLCEVVQVATFLQDEPTAAICCMLLTSSLRLGLLSHNEENLVSTWDPSVWDSVSSITEQLLALPEADLQRIVSRFHLQEMLAAPVKLLIQWLRHIEASGGVLDMHCLEKWFGWDQVSVDLLSRLWCLLPGLKMTDLVLPADPASWYRRISSTSVDGIVEQLRQAELPAVNSVTSIEIRVATTLEHLNTFLKLVPNVKSVSGADCFLYPYLFFWPSEQPGDQGQAAVNDFADILPQLQSLQTFHVSVGPVEYGDGRQAYRTCVGSLQQCTALTELWLDVVNLHYKIPDTLEALPLPLSKLQKFRVNVQLHTPFKVARIRAQVAVLSGYSSLTSLSLYFCMDRGISDYAYNLPVVEEILSVLGEVLQPLKLLRHLCLDTRRLTLSRRWQCTINAVASFIDVLEKLDSLDVDGSLMCMLLPVVPSVSVGQSLDCSAHDLQVKDAHGMLSLDMLSTLSTLTGLTRLSLDNYSLASYKADDDPDSDEGTEVGFGLADLLKYLPDLRVFDVYSRAEEDIVCRSILPHVAALSKLERFSYVLVWGQHDCVGWKQLAKAETLLMADSLTHLTLRSDSSEHGVPGIVLKEDVPQVYSVLARLTALRELKVDMLPTHSATCLISLATLKDLEQFSFDVGSCNDKEHLHLLESDVEEVGVAIGSLTKLSVLKLTAFSVTSTAIADLFAAHLTTLCQLRSVDVNFRLAGVDGYVVDTNSYDADVMASENAMDASVSWQCWGAYVPVTALRLAYTFL